MSKRTLIILYVIAAAIVVALVVYIIKYLIKQKKIMEDLLPKAAAFIEPIEGFSPVPVWDYKQWTWGFGTKAGDNKANRPTGVITREKAHLDLIEELKPLYKKINGLNVSDNAKIALLSFGFNEGSGNLDNILERIVNGKSSQDVVDALKLYTLAGGVHLPGLVDRREKEAGLYLA